MWPAGALLQHRHHGLRREQLQRQQQLQHRPSLQRGERGCCMLLQLLLLHGGLLHAKLACEACCRERSLAVGAEADGLGKL